MAAVFFAVTLVLWVLNNFLPPALQPPATAGLPETAREVTAGGLSLKALFITSVVEMFLIACGTAAIILHVSKMTRAILQALETTARR